MATKIIMPKAGMAMEEGTIVKWLKQEGEVITIGEPLLEIHTDKVNMEVEAPADGVLLKILGQEGDIIPVTHTIGYIGEAGETLGEEMEMGKQGNKPLAETTVQPELPQERPQKPGFTNAEGKIAATPLARTLARERGIHLGTLKATGKYGEIRARDVSLMQSAAITPLAKRIAEKNNIDLEKIQGSGYRGKIRKEDLIQENKEIPMMEITARQDTGEREGLHRKPLAGMRRIIAERMLSSHLQAPPVTLNTKADVTALTNLKEQLLTQVSLKVSYNDFVIKAVALALQEYPNINVRIAEEEILYRKEIHIGMAVALEDGLIVPVIKDADKLTIRELAEKTKELAGKGREGKLLPSEIEDGSFTVSNLGMYDILSFTPIINQPESAILGVCAIEEELKMMEGKIKNRKMMGLSLTVDHRVIDGAQGAIFLKRIKTLLENPLGILL